MTNEKKLAILHSLDRAKDGDLILNPESCADWIPCQDDENSCTPSEAWAVAFDAFIIGTEYGHSYAMNKATLAEYYKGLKDYQLKFWRDHAEKIKATIDGDILNEYEGN